MLRASGVPTTTSAGRTRTTVYDRLELTCRSAPRATTTTASSCRLEEIRQQCGEDPAPVRWSRCPTRPGQRRDPRVVLPQGGDRHDDRRRRSQHFKIVMEGIRVRRQRGLLLRREAATASSASSSSRRPSGTAYRVRLVRLLYGASSQLVGGRRGCRRRPICRTWAAAKRVRPPATASRRRIPDRLRSGGPAGTRRASRSTMPTIKIDGKGDPLRESGRHDHPGGAPRRDRHPALLLAPGPQRRRPTAGCAWSRCCRRRGGRR